MAYDKKRIVVGLGLAAVLVTLMFTVPAGSWFALLVFVAVAGLGLNEFYQISEKVDIPSSRLFGTVIGITYVAATFLSIKFAPASADKLLWAILPLTILAIFVHHLFIEDCSVALKKLNGTLFGFLYIPFLFSFLVRVYLSGDLSKAGYAGIFLLFMVKGADAGAYFIGSKFGKNKLAPKLSPKKSWEGLAGGIGANLVFSILWLIFTKGELGAYHFNLLHAIALSFLIPLIGLAGDLIESQIKRVADIKDSGVVAHGLGGILDMIDSVIFAAPFLFIYIQLFLK